jgi:hypothetical protein
MRRTVLLVMLGLLAAGCSLTADEETTTTTTIPSWALDPDAPGDAASASPAMGWDGDVAGEAWLGWAWRAKAGGPIDLAYLGEGCAGWAPRAPAVEVNLPDDGGRWVFSFAGDVPTTGWGDHGEAPPGAVIVVRRPDGAFTCNAVYQDWQYFPGPAVEIPGAEAGTYDIWVGAPQGATIDGQVVVATPAATFPTTTTTTNPGDPPVTPASTFPTTTG